MILYYVQGCFGSGLKVSGNYYDFYIKLRVFQLF